MMCRSLLNAVTKPRKQAMFVSLEEVRTATSTTNYSKKYLIGEGRFGSVYYGRLVTGDEVAVKVNSYKGHQSLKDFKSEVRANLFQMLRNTICRHRVSFPYPA